MLASEGVERVGEELGRLALGEVELAAGEVEVCVHDPRQRKRQRKRERHLGVQARVTDCSTRRWERSVARLSSPYLVRIKSSTRWRASARGESLPP